MRNPSAIVFYVLTFVCCSTSNSAEPFTLAQKSLQRLSSVEFTGREPGTSGHKQAQQYIVSVFNSDEKSSDKIVLHNFTYHKNFQTKLGTNIIFHKIGTIYPNKLIVITAHYDHLGKQGRKVFLGADDNASGTAIMLGLQQFFKNKKTKYSLLFVATDAEEDDLAGSRALVQSNYIIDKNIILNINLDMVAHGYRKKYLYVHKKSADLALDKILNKYHQIDSNVILKSKRYLTSDRSSISRRRIDLAKASDHYEFAKIGIGYLFITGENHKHYHKPTDSYDKVDINFYGKVFASMKSLITLIDNEI